MVFLICYPESILKSSVFFAFQWASDLSCRLLAIYNEEYEKRKDFLSQFEGHFLQSLFPGFEDNPPAFATQAPVPFDVNLPQVHFMSLFIVISVYLQSALTKSIEVSH